MIVIISLRPHLEDIGLCVNAVVSDVPAADHKRVQGNNGFCPQHGGMMTSMHKVYIYGSSMSKHDLFLFFEMKGYKVYYDLCLVSLIWRPDLTFDLWLICLFRWPDRGQLSSASWLGSGFGSCLRRTCRCRRKQFLLPAPAFPIGSPLA